MCSQSLENHPSAKRVCLLCAVRPRSGHVSVTASHQKARVTELRQSQALPVVIRMMHRIHVHLTLMEDATHVPGNNIGPDGKLNVISVLLHSQLYLKSVPAVRQCIVVYPMPPNSPDFTCNLACNFLSLSTSMAHGKSACETKHGHPKCIHVVMATAVCHLHRCWHRL